MRKEILKWAVCLKNFGIKKDDVVSVICENRVELMTISLATILLGAIVAPLNYAYKECKFYCVLKTSQK